MAWERNFGDRVLRIREKELNYIIEVRYASISGYFADVRALIYAIFRFFSMLFGTP
jgi:hypothetical protein